MSSPQTYYIGIDVGTSSARACILADSGEIVSLAESSIKTWKSSTIHYEQSTQDIWKSVCQCVANAIQGTGSSEYNQPVDPDKISGIGFDATCSLAVFDTQNSQPVCVTPPKFTDASDNVRNVILWLDHRASEETDIINSTHHEALRYVGGKMNIEMELPKILWLKRNMPSELFNHCKFFDLTDALTFLATDGCENRSFCSVVCKQAFIPKNDNGNITGWQSDLLSAINLSELCTNSFSRLGSTQTLTTAGQFIGYLCPLAAKSMGLPTGIPVGSGVIDAYAGWIGTVGANLQDTPKNSQRDISSAFYRLAAVAGTSTCHLAMSPKPIFVPGVWGPYCDIIIPDFWMAEGGQSATGELLRFFIENHPAFTRVNSIVKTNNQSVFDYLNEKLDIMLHEHKASGKRGNFLAVLTRDLFVYPDVFANRSPLSDSRMSGMICGITPDVSENNMALIYLAAMEAIAFQTRQIISRMNQRGHQINTIFMSGSLAMNKTLINLIASVCCMPVVIPYYVKASVVIGAAMLGARAAATSPDSLGSSSGLLETNLWNIMQRLTKTGHTVQPTANEAELLFLDTKYEIFESMCHDQISWRGKMDEALNRV